MALARAAVEKIPLGAERPRVAPPLPARSLVAEYIAQAEEIGYTLMPWQKVALRYMTALGPGNRWAYPEFASIVSRQNGKTTLLVPVIVKRLREGRRLMHTAQNRELPREVFGLVADVMQDKYPGELKRKPRFANGQEEILTLNGGRYRIVAPTRGGARGPSNDDVIIDELRESEDFDFIAAAEPTLTAADNGQIIYLSNAGTSESRVLNALRDRAGEDPSLAYLEWSAAPERDSADRGGWLEANPAVGHMPHMWSYLERKHNSYRLAGEMGIFETEHLCRWVSTLVPPILRPDVWDQCEGETEHPQRPSLGISLDPTGNRASGVLAWQQADGRVALRVIADATGSPIDVQRFGRELKELARAYRVAQVGFDPVTDAELAKYFKATAVSGTKFTNASALFVTRAEAGTLVWDEAAQMREDLYWTGRKEHSSPGTWTAMKISDEHSVTSVLAAIRAVWLASGPKSAAPRILIPKAGDQ